MEFIVWMGIIVWTGRTNSAEGGVVGGRGTIILESGRMIRMDV
jgi:hypothetical protein